VTDIQKFDHEEDSSVLLTADTTKRKAESSIGENDPNIIQ